MSLFRIAIVLSLGVALMPSDRAAAGTAVRESGHRCPLDADLLRSQRRDVRNRRRDVGRPSLKKAEFAGKMAYDIAQRASVEGPADATAPTRLEGLRHAEAR